MKKILLIAALAAVLPWRAGAQVEKQVEVTKAYVPRLDGATKLAMVPDMTDTTRMRPEIDYTITPLSMTTTLSTRPIRPATVTYWEFNRPTPFYLKVGAGYPLNSVVDFYASTQNPGTGYAIGYVNHEGLYGKLRNDYDVKRTATQMLNRVGGAAGKYFGRRTLEGELSYENRMYHRYGAHSEFLYGAAGADALPEADAPGRMIDYGAADLRLRFGDDFEDLSHFNFEVEARGGLFFDHSERIGAADRAQQLSLGVSARIARGWGKHRFSLSAGYDREAGRKRLEGLWTDRVLAGIRYGVDGGVVRLEAGADFYYTRIEGYAGREQKCYVIPFARLDFNLGAAGLRPFVEIDGDVRDNSMRSLVERNPYAAEDVWGDLASVDYDGRAGIGGSLWRGKVNYRAYVAFSIHDNHLYWIGQRHLLAGRMVDYGCFSPVAGRQTVGSLNGEVEYRPVTSFLLTLGAHGYLYNDDEYYANGSPAFRGDLALRYEGRKISFGAGVEAQSRRSWSVAVADMQTLADPVMETVSAPFDFDLKADFAWRISSRVEAFVEGRNLANRRIYAWPGYRSFGARVTVGAKLVF